MINPCFSKTSLFDKTPAKTARRRKNIGQALPELPGG